MSRTDKTKPWRVRVAEHNPRENHNHENGICDLPASPLDRYEQGGRLGVWNRQHCSWSDWNICYRGVCCYGCGCRMCTAYWERREERRRDRHRAKSQIRTLLKERNATYR